MCPHGPQPPYPKDEDIHVVTKDEMQMGEQPPELRPDVYEIAQSEPFPWVGFIIWFALVNLMFWYLTIGQYS